MVSVFEKHKKEIELHEKMMGKDVGKIVFAISILSDIEEEHPETREEVEEVKELLISLRPVVLEHLKWKVVEVL